MIEYQQSLDGITAEKLDGFFVGWPKHPSPERHLDLLRGSDHIVLAVDSETQRVIGFVNAVSDGVLSAYLPLLEVLPDYKGQGIGQELMKQILVLLDGLYMIDLICDKDLEPFYSRLDMKPFGAMCIRNWDKQSGLD